MRVCENLGTQRPRRPWQEGQDVARRSGRKSWRSMELLIPARSKTGSLPPRYTRHTLWAKWPEAFHPSDGKNRFVSRFVSPHPLQSFHPRRPMPRPKQHASAADRLREFRKRQRAEKAQAALPTPAQIIERDEATEQVEQLSRASGV